MPRSPATSIALLTGAGLATLWAFNWLLEQRFNSGDERAPYSTLRADPLGAKALHDALNRLPNTTCERHFRSLAKLDGARGSTLVCLHVPPETFHDGDELDGDALVKFAGAGGRVVITLDGQRSNWDILSDAAEKRREENRKRRIEAKKKQEDAKKETKEGDAKKPGEDAKANKDADTAKDEKKTPEERRRERMKELLDPASSLQEALGVTITQKNFVMTAKGALKLEPQPTLPLKAEDLPGWFTRTTIEFADKKPAKTSEKEQDHDEAGEASASRWEILAKYQDGVMLAQRRFGAGMVIVATDSYFASNEALFKSASTKFLAWLIGGARTVIFDESHLGTTENPGVMALARRHHLHGLFFGGLLLFALFVWKSSMSLVPAQDEEKAGAIVAGQGATAGLVSLLRRGVPLPQVLRKGLEAWRHGHAQPNAAVQSRLERAAQLLPPEHARRAKSGAMRDIYRLICETLHPSSSR